jgi:hypothetical protein
VRWRSVCCSGRSAEVLDAVAPPGPARIHGRSRGKIRHHVIHRIVPNLNVRDASVGHDFYVDFLGLEKAFDLGWIASFRSPENRSIQVSLVSGDASAPEDSAISVNVDDVDGRQRRR